MHSKIASTKAHPINLVSAQEFLKLMQTPRFSRTVGEEACIDSLLRDIKGIQQDTYGNLYVLQGETTTMFSCHTDTVHKRSEVDKFEVEIDASGYMRRKGGGVLGADCGTGWIIMLCMLRAGVPGLYVWHRDEEIGGGGSRYFADDKAGVLAGIERCVAFDRAGYADVITHQAGTRGCSDTFATALAASLNAAMPDPREALAPFPPFKPDPTGVFTDSHNYIGVIPECTNLSVGYFEQHTRKEEQDMLFLEDFVLACCSVNWEGLPTERVPVDEYIALDSVLMHRDVPWWDDYGIDNPEDDLYSMLEHEGISELCRTYPDSVADLLQGLGYDIDALRVELGV